MKVPELQNFLKARDMHFKSCGRKGKEKGGTTEALQKCSRNYSVSKNFVFNFQSCYISNKLFHFSFINVRLAGSKNRLFFTVFMFFFSWRRTDFVVLTRKSTVAILQSDVRWHTRTFRFRPLSPLKFLFPLSDIILLIHSDLLWVEYRWKRPVYYLFILHKVFTMSLVSKCWDHMCWSR